ncbi:MAG: phospholipase D-like domain-containing protein [Candidatus Thorarchaeota archaeon]
MGSHPKTMNTVLKELFQNSAIFKTQDDEYRVPKDIYYEYKDYFKDKTEQDVKLSALRISRNTQDNIKREFQRWLEFRKISSLLVDNHLFLEGENLDELSKHVLRESKAEIIVVNPFVKRCDLVESLRTPVKSNVNVKLLTRPSDNDEIVEYHTSLTKAGIQIYQNRIVHAKLIVADRGFVIIS